MTPPSAAHVVTAADEVTKGILTLDFFAQPQGFQPRDPLFGGFQKVFAQFREIDRGEQELITACRTCALPGVS
jgi:hypothetical protein